MKLWLNDILIANATKGLKWTLWLEEEIWSANSISELNSQQVIDRHVGLSIDLS